MIPVLDLRDFNDNPEGFAKDFGSACRDTGFLLLEGHWVDQSLIDMVFASASWFFELPEDEKAKYKINAHNRGWAPQGSESLDEASGQIDRKEAFNVGLDLAANDPRVMSEEPFRGLNVWPASESFRETLLCYYDAAWALSVELHRAVAMDLDLAANYFLPHFDAPLATLRLLQYPASNGRAGGIGAGAHSDYGSLTLLMTDGEPGLQVRSKTGEWVDVPHRPGAFVVNIGDCLMRWTNDIYQSTEHRVLPPQRERRSIAFFLDPNPDSVIEALPGTGEPRYAPVTSADYLRSRLDATYEKEKT